MPKLSKKKDSYEPRWWGLLSWQIQRKVTTPLIGNFYHLQTLYVVLVFQKRLGDGDYPALFNWGESNALFFIEKFTLINKAKSRIKVLEPFEDRSKNSPMVNAILISYGGVFKR